MMGFRSRTSVFRLLQDEASYDKQKEFLDALRGQSALPFDEQDWADLNQALEISRVGAETYWCNQAMRYLVFQSNRPADEWLKMEIVEKSDQDWVTLACPDAFWERLLDGKSMEITLVGCCDPRFFAALSGAMRGKRTGCQVEIRHYIQAQGTALIGAICAMQPLLYDTRYHACIPGKGEKQEILRRLYADNSVLVDWMDERGRRRFFHMRWTERHTLRVLVHQSETVYRFYYDCLHQHDAAMEPINTLFSGPCRPEDYLTYTEAYCQLENKRDLYDIKQDIPINYIHPDLLVHAVLDGFRQTGFADEAALIPLIAQFYQIHLKRYNNFISKRRVTHTIFSIDAMRQFAQSGKTSDHFFAMRPYTPEERVAILHDLRRQTQTNPYFTIYFFRPGVAPVPQELGLYDGKGLLMTKAYTDYRLDGDHSETLICQSELCDRFKDYFLHDLLTNAVLPQSETLRLLDELSALAGGMAMAVNE